MKKQAHIVILAIFAVVLASACQYTCTPTGTIQEISEAMEPDPNLASGDTCKAADSTITVAKPAVAPVGRVVGSKRITTAGADTIAADNVMLLIDSGAVSRDVQISIVATSEENSGEIPANMGNLTAGGVVYRMLPDGQKFSKDITIAMRYDSASLPYGFTPDDIYTFFYNDKTRMWQQVERDSVDTENQIVYSRTNHFTDYINGVLKVPENSDAMAYTPTSIKELKATDPMDGITLIAPPEANNMGTANLTYPLTIPAGRRGMQPRLAVTYNSGGGSGILGLGWGLPVSEISVETRWGVPLYDLQQQTENYLIDGTTLVTSYTDSLGNFRLSKPVYHREYEQRDNRDTVRFFPRVEGSFRKIERIGTTPNDYHWVVTDKDGTQHYYGSVDDSRLCDYRGNIAKWMIEKSVDTYGNTVIYKYITKHTQKHGGIYGRQILVDSIVYTGNENENGSGKYKIAFKYCEKRDKSNSFRYGREETDHYVVDRIRILYENTIIKEYYFGYKSGDFGKTLLCNIIESYEDSAKYQVYPTIYGDSNILFMEPYDRCGVNFDEITPYLHLTHTFDYHEMENNLLFGPPQELPNSYSDTSTIFKNPFSVNDIPTILREHSMIGGSVSSGWNVSGGFNVGTGYKLLTKDMSAGGHYSFSKDVAQGVVLLVDVNGDGYPDKLYRTISGQLKCLPQDPVSGTFGPPINITGINSFQRSGGSTHNWGIEASIPTSGAGISWSDSRNSTSTYTSDVNGDGFVDIIENGSVYLNRGNYIFSNVTDNDTIHVGGSCGNNVIVFNGTVDTTIFDDGAYIVDSMECTQIWETKTVYETVIGEGGKLNLIPHDVMVLDTEYCNIISDTNHYTYPRRYEPEIDLVRMWKAPYTGNIRIHGTAKLTDEKNSYRMATRATDGVWISVHILGDTNLVVSETVSMGQTLQMDDTLRNVNAGDTLVFRMNSIDKRLYDEIEWNPTIEYLSATHTNGLQFESSRTAGNGDSIYKFNYSKDYILSASVPVGVSDSISSSQTDSLKMKCHIISTDPTLQKVVFSIIEKDTGLNNTGIATITPVDTLWGALDTIYQKSWEIPKNRSVVLRLTPLYGDQINWGAVTADAEIILKDSNVAKLNNDSLRYHPAIEHVFYDYLLFPAERAKPNNTLGHIVYARLTTKNSSVYSDTLCYTVKDVNNNILKSGVISATNNQPDSIIILDADFTYDDTCIVEFYTTDTILPNIIEKIEVNFGNGIWYNAGLYAKYSPDNKKHHGLLYRGWGQFGYKSDDTTCRYVKRDKVLPQPYYVDTSSVPHITITCINSFNVNNLNADSNPELPFDSNFLNPLSDTFFEMTADAIYHRWTSFGNAVTSSKLVMSLSNNNTASGNGDSIVVVDMCQSPLPVVMPGTKIKAVNKLTMSKGFSSTIKNTSISDGHSSLLGDYMDLNGDRYPDIVSEKEIQYSKAQGGLSNLTKGYVVADGINRSNYTAQGSAYNGTFLNAAYELSSNAKNSKVITAVNGLARLLGSNISITNNFTKNTLMDINGDGLPDIVYSTGSVRYNMGYGFTNKCAIASQQPSNSKSVARAVTAGSGFNVANTSITGGISVNKAENETLSVLADINGDGLPDLISASGVRFNNGDGTFANTIYTSTGAMDQSTTTSLCLNISGTHDWPLPGLCIPAKIGVSVGGGGSISLTTTGSEFIDMNNDGYVDYVFIDSNKIKVRYSRLGKANLLKSVKNFAYAQYTIDYELSQSSIDCPQRHWNMSSLTIYDGYRGDGCDKIYKRFSYSNRKYDRYERDDYGYGTVSTNDYLSLSDYNANNVYRISHQTYLNDNYYHSHLKTFEQVSDGIKSVGTSYEYRNADLNDGHYLEGVTSWCESDSWPALASESTKYNEGSGTIMTQRDYYYGPYGNVVRVNDLGDVADSTDDYTVYLDYALDPMKHIVSNVSGLNIPGYRKRYATYTSEGSLESITVDNNPSPQSEYRYEYDHYGNVIVVETPAKENATGAPYRITYRYDTNTHSLPIHIENSEHHYSESIYDLLWQKPIQTVDIGGNRIYYSYDSHGRASTITAPMETENGAPYTVKFEYWDKNRFIVPLFNQVWCLPEGEDPDENMLSQYEKIGNETIGYPYPFWARTSNHDPDHPDNDIQTITFSDGLGRIIQGKKDIELNNHEYRSVAGTIHYDGMGRKKKEYMLTQEDLSIPDSNLNTHVNTMPYSQTSYDYLDRITETVFADSTTTRNTYSIAPDGNNINRFQNEITDQNGNTSYIYTDTRQQNRLLVNALSDTTIFLYDAVGQLVSSTDPEHNTTTHLYDFGGRRTDRFHPASGHTVWEYDAAGNMVKQTQNSGEFVEYEYNYSRLVHISYSDRQWNDVWYEYGSAGSGNDAGRLVRQQDASGVQEFNYDCMGNVTLNRHTYVQPNQPQPLTLETGWEYDSWGRVHKITYPDLEEVIYLYDHGGNVYRIEGYKPDIGSITYIKELQYDCYEQRIYQLDGDNVETFYTYHPLNRRLVSMRNQSPACSLLQCNRYTYDPVGNITHIDDSGLNTRHQTFSYDSINRLTASTGSWKSGALTYTSNYTYSAAGRILTKNVTSQRKNTATGIYNLNYQNEYIYPSSGNIFAPDFSHDALTGRTDFFEWDGNGNMVRVEGSDPYTERRLCWTEDNRLQGFVEWGDDGGIAAYYNYTAEGERNYKFTSPRLNIQQNAYDPMAPSPPDPPAPYTHTLVYPTLYASPLITINRHGYTKHYFEGTNRICSKIGGGFSNVDWNSVCDTVQTLDGSNYKRMYRNQNDGIRNTFGNCSDIAVEIDNTIDLYDLVRQEHDRRDPEPAFYYHSDHLGSTAYITDENGQVTQTLNYLPYGEDWVDLHGITFDTTRLGMYRFNGKEKDYESGFHYYGARYYWSELLAGWLSVDPMMDKYPSISPYAYCAWNPITIIDPDGRDGVPAINKREKSITVQVDIIFYMPNPGHIGRKTIDNWTKHLVSDINKEWNSQNWTYEYQGEKYSVNFDFSYWFDNKVHTDEDFKFDKKNNKKNYIELLGHSAYQYDKNSGKSIYKLRSKVRGGNTGLWHYDTKAAAHEAGHLLGLPDRYHEDSQAASGYSADPGWQGTIMAEPGGIGRVTQKDINDVLDRMLKTDKQ